MGSYRLTLSVLVLVILGICVSSHSEPTAYGFPNIFPTESASDSSLYYDTKGTAMVAVPEGAFKIGYEAKHISSLCIELKPQDAFYSCDVNSPLGVNSLDDSYPLEPEDVTVQKFYLD